MFLANKTRGAAAGAVAISLALGGIATAQAATATDPVMDARRVVALTASDPFGTTATWSVDTPLAELANQDWNLGARSLSGDLDANAALAFGDARVDLDLTFELDLVEQLETLVRPALAGSLLGAEIGNQIVNEVVGQLEAHGFGQVVLGDVIQAGAISDGSLSLVDGDLTSPDFLRTATWAVDGEFSLANLADLVALINSQLDIAESEIPRLIAYLNTSLPDIPLPDALVEFVFELISDIVPIEIIMPDDVPLLMVILMTPLLNSINAVLPDAVLYALLNHFSLSDLSVNLGDWLWSGGELVVTIDGEPVVDGVLDWLVANVPGLVIGNIPFFRGLIVGMFGDISGIEIPIPESEFIGSGLGPVVDDLIEFIREYAAGVVNQLEDTLSGNTALTLSDWTALIGNAPIAELTISHSGSGLPLVIDSLAVGATDFTPTFTGGVNFIDWTFANWGNQWQLGWGVGFAQGDEAATGPFREAGAREAEGTARAAGDAAAQAAARIDGETTALVNARAAGDAQAQDNRREAGIVDGRENLLTYLADSGTFVRFRLGEVDMGGGIADVIFLIHERSEELGALTITAEIATEIWDSPNWEDWGFDGRLESWNLFADARITEELGRALGMSVVLHDDDYILFIADTAQFISEAQFNQLPEWLRANLVTQFFAG